MNSIGTCLIVLGLTSATLVLSATPANCPQSEPCLDDLLKAKQEQDVVKACKVLTKGSKCLGVLDTKCPKFRKEFDIEDINLDDMEMQRGCDGACGEALNKCISPITKAMNPNAIYDVKLCGTITTAFNCIEGIKSTGKCAANVTKAIVALTQLEKYKDFSSLCDDQGKPTKCYDNLQICMKDLENVNNKTSAPVACKDVEKYLQCESDSECKGTLQSFRMMVKNKLENMETNSSCPTVGTCDKRILKCVGDLNIDIIKGKKYDEKHKTKICGDINKTIKCFDFVRKDSICIVDQAMVTDDEKKFRTYKSEGCGGAASIIISTTLILIASTTSIIKNMF